MAFFVHDLTGSEGKVTVPALGAVVGITRHWTLKRHEEASPGNPGLWTLRASFSYVNSHLMNDEDVQKKVIIVVTKERHYQVRGATWKWDGETLVMEGCELCLPEE